MDNADSSVDHLDSIIDHGVVEHTMEVIAEKFEKPVGITSTNPATPRKVTIFTLEKWKRENPDLELSDWLEPIQNGEVITGLRCKSCLEYVDEIKGKRFFTPEWTSANGTQNFRLSSVKCHAASFLHRQTMQLYKSLVLQKRSIMAGLGLDKKVKQKEQKEPKKEQTHVDRKMAVAYFMAKNNMNFQIFPDMMKLIVNEGNLSNMTEIACSYTNAIECAEMTDFNAKSLIDTTSENAANCNFLGFSMVNCTFCSKELKLLYINHFDPDEFVASSLTTKPEFLNLAEVGSSDINGMKKFFEDSLELLDVDVKNKMISICTGGTSVDTIEISNNFYDIMSQEMSWVLNPIQIYHNLDGTFKKASENTYLMDINEMFVNMYSLHKNNPKLLHRLSNLVKQDEHRSNNAVNNTVDLKDISWITFIGSALQDSVDNLNLYLSDIEAFACATDNSNQVVITENLTRWKNVNFYIGIAFFLHLIKPIMEMSEIWQTAANLTILDIVISLKKTRDTILSVKNVCERFGIFSLHYLKIVLNKIQEEPPHEHLAEQLNAAKDYLTHYAVDWCNKFLQCFEDQFQSSDQKILDCMCVLLNTQTWKPWMTPKQIGENSNEAGNTSDNESGPDFVQMDQILHSIIKRFEIPLSRAGCQVHLIELELRTMYSYATEYMDMEKQPYLETWRKIFMANKFVDRWGNILKVVELCFVIPLFSGKDKKFYKSISYLSDAEHDWRHLLSISRICSLLRINLEGNPYGEYDPKLAVALFSRSKHQTSSKRKKHSISENGSSSIQKKVLKHSLLFESPLALQDS